MSCKHIWIRQVSDSCHWYECVLCPLQRAFSSEENRNIYFTEKEWDIKGE